MDIRKIANAQRKGKDCFNAESAEDNVADRLQVTGNG